VWVRVTLDLSDEREGRSGAGGRRERERKR